MLTSTVGTGGAVAQCARHPQTQALTTCDRCGDYACAECITGAGICAGCGLREVEQQQAGVDRSARRVVWSLRVFAALCVLEIVIYAAVIAGAMQPPNPADAEDVHLAEWVGLPVALSVFASMFLFAAWMRRTHRGTAPVASHAMEFGPNAWGWFFCPVLNLWKPFQAVRELYTSRSGQLQAPQLFGVWWGFWIVWNMVARLTGNMVEGGVTPSVEILDYLLGGTTAVLAAAVVSRVTAAKPTPR